jgi:hypothetical protein
LTMWATGEAVGRVIAFAVWSHDVGINDAVMNDAIMNDVMNVDTVLSGQYNLLKLPFILWTFVAIAVLRLAMLAALLLTRLVHAQWPSHVSRSRALSSAG